MAMRNADSPHPPFVIQLIVPNPRSAQPRTTSYDGADALARHIDNETLGGATTHTEISGVVDYKCKDDAECLKTIRAIVDKLGKPKVAGFSREKPAAPKKPGKKGGKTVKAEAK